MARLSDLPPSGQDVSISKTDLTDRVAVVTGGGRGMGRAIAGALLDSGASVFVAARTQRDLDETKALLGQVEVFSCDVSDPKRVAALFAAVDERFGRLDVLVCSHGIYPGTRPAVEIPLAEYERTVAVNFTGTFLCAQHAARAMLAAGNGGSIVAISSMNGLSSQYGAADYDASKAAVHGLVRAFAVELGSADIAVNAIAPGWIRTAMSEEELEELEGMTLNPTGRVGEPDDIARAALWLADPRNRFVTGSVFVIDGGQTAMLPLPWHAETAAA
ncbi:MAG: SDR family oxidoreductase [Actinomycetota bacterium]|nr:SDR family oxidoreductase [Actinomycetota bacterium]